MTIMSVSEARASALASILKLTPTERQQILRRLKYGPALPREELAEYANKLKRDVLNKREKASE